MRLLPVAAVAVLALLALAAPAAAQPVLPGDLGAALDAAPAAPAAPVPAFLAEPTAMPDVVGHAGLVARAAALAEDPGAVDELALLAAEQHLHAALDPAEPLTWRLGRFLPAAPDLPLASIAAPVSREGAALAAPARAAVAVVGVAGLAALVVPKVPLLPLYSRIQREEAMLNARRSQLYELVRTEPGIHLSDLVRRSGLGWGAALYHLGVLEKNRMLVAHDEGGFKRYFANGMHRPAEMQRLVALRHGAARALFDAVVAAPGRSGRELSDHLGLSPSTLARASERLEDAGLVRRERAGRRVLYFPAEPGTVATAPVAVAA